MTNKSNTAGTPDPVAELEALRARGAAELETARREAAERRAELARIDQTENQRLAALEAEFATALAAKEHAAATHAAITSLDEAAAEYAPLAAAADEKVAAVLALGQHVAKLYGEALRAELDRLAAGERLGACHRKLAELDPGRPAPTVGGKRLGARGANDELAALQRLACSVNPDLQQTQAQLDRFEGWRPPHYAYIQGKKTLIS
jgi:hypothetical protein